MGIGRHKLCSGGLAVVLLAVGGCSTYPRVPCAPRVTPALGTPNGAGATVDVLFATDRRPTGATEPALQFGVERSRGLTYGRGTVSIPPRHLQGRIDEGGLGAGGDPNRTVVLMTAETLGPTGRGERPEPFLAELRRRVALSARHEVLVFVHGFAGTFEESVRRTAQIAHDIRFDGVPIAYTWPTQGNITSYLVDGANAEWTVPYFVRFLDLLVEESGAEHIHVMAHSMGTRVLAQGLRNYMALRGGLRRTEDGHLEVGQGETPPFDQVIFAAADLDAEIFERDYVPFVLAAADRATIYVSTRDVALGLAVRLNGYFRLGQGDLPNVDLDAMRRIDVVDVTAFDTDFLGHFYYSQCPRVLDDLAAVLRTPGAEAAGASAGTQGGQEDDKARRRLQRTFFYRMQP